MEGNFSSTSTTFLPLSFTFTKSALELTQANRSLFSLILFGKFSFGSPSIYGLKTMVKLFQLVLPNYSKSYQFASVLPDRLCRKNPLLPCVFFSLTATTLTTLPTLRVKCRNFTLVFPTPRNSGILALCPII